MRSPRHVARYSNLQVSYINHHNPDLVLLDKDGAEIHRIDLTRLSTTRSIHKLMAMLGLKQKCDDSNRACVSWATSGECERNAEYMAEQCPKACKMCTDGDDAQDEASGCRDLASERDCQYWSTMGECEVNRGFMEEKCPRSCRFCSANKSDKEEL